MIEDESQRLVSFESGLQKTCVWNYTDHSIDGIFMLYHWKEKMLRKKAMDSL